MHPNIIRLYETLKASSLYCLVTEYASGGELVTFLRNHREERLTEKEAWPFGRQLISALFYMHKKGVVHRDLKMENIMLNGNKTHIKIIDFGLSNLCGKGTLLKTHCGSPEYAAPELFDHGREYGTEVDIWSLGIILYAIVVGKLPFTTVYVAEQKRQKLLQMIQRGLTDKHDREMAHLSTDCRNLLRQLIEPVPELRCPLTEITEHSWITKNASMIFIPYKAPKNRTKIQLEVINELAVLKGKTPDEIEDTVRDYRCDELSAMYNMMVDNHCQGLNATAVSSDLSPSCSRTHTRPQARCRTPYSRLASPPSGILPRPTLESKRMDFLLGRAISRIHDNKAKENGKAKKDTGSTSSPSDKSTANSDGQSANEGDAQGPSIKGTSLKRFMRRSSSAIPRLRQTLKNKAYKRAKSTDTARTRPRPKTTATATLTETHPTTAEEIQLKSSLKKINEPSLTVSVTKSSLSTGSMTSPKSKSPGCTSVTFADDVFENKDNTATNTLSPSMIKKKEIVPVDVHQTNDKTGQSPTKDKSQGLSEDTVQSVKEKLEKKQISAADIKAAITAAKASGAIPKYSFYQNYQDHVQGVHNVSVFSPSTTSTDSHTTSSPMSPPVHHLRSGPGSGAGAGAGGGGGARARGVGYRGSPILNLRSGFMSPKSDPTSPAVNSRNILYCRNLSDDEKLKQGLQQKYNNGMSTTDTESSRSSLRSRELRFRVLTDFKIESVDSLDVTSDSNGENDISISPTKIGEWQASLSANVKQFEDDDQRVRDGDAHSDDLPLKYEDQSISVNQRQHDSTSKLRLTEYYCTSAAPIAMPLCQPRGVLMRKSLSYPQTQLGSSQKQVIEQRQGQRQTADVGEESEDSESDERMQSSHSLMRVPNVSPASSCVGYSDSSDEGIKTKARNGSSSGSGNGNVNTRGARTKRQTRFTRGLGYIGKRISLSPTKKQLTIPLATVESLSEGSASTLGGEIDNCSNVEATLVTARKWMVSPVIQRRLTKDNVHINVPDESIILENAQSSKLKEKSGTACSLPGHRSRSRMSPCGKSPYHTQTAGNSKLVEPRSTGHVYQAPKQTSPAPGPGRSASPAVTADRLKECHLSIHGTPVLATKKDEDSPHRRPTWRQNVSKILRRNHSSSPTKQQPPKDVVKSRPPSQGLSGSHSQEAYYKDMEAQWTGQTEKYQEEKQSLLHVTPSPVACCTPKPVCPIFNLQVTWVNNNNTLNQHHTQTKTQPSSCSRCQSRSYLTPSRPNSTAHPPSPCLLCHKQQRFSEKSSANKPRRTQLRHFNYYAAKTSQRPKWC